MEVQPSVWSGFGSSLAMSLASLGLVCLIAWGALRWLGRRWGRQGDGGEGGLRVRARLGLEPRRTLYVVQAGPRCFLIGSGEGGISLLAELAESDVPTSPEGTAPANLERWLKAVGQPRKVEDQARDKAGVEKVSEGPGQIATVAGAGAASAAAVGGASNAAPSPARFEVSPPDVSPVSASQRASGADR